MQNNLDKLSANLNVYFKHFNEQSIIAIVDVQGKIKFGNYNFCELVECDHLEEVQGIESLQFLTPESKNLLDNIYHELSNKSMWRGNLSLICAQTQSTKWVSASLAPVVQKGRVFEIFCFLREVTREVELGQVSAENEMLFKSLFETAHSGAMILERREKGYFVKAYNAAAATIDNRTRHEVLGKFVKQAFPGMKASGLYQLIKEVDQQNTIKEFSLLRYSDEMVTSYRDGKVYKIPNGDIVVIYQDITERLQQIREIDHYKLTLEKIAHYESHKVRSPVSTMQGLIHLLKQEDLSKNARQLLHFLDDSCNKLDRVTREVVASTYEKPVFMVAEKKSAEG